MKIEVWQLPKHERKMKEKMLQTLNKLIEEKKILQTNVVSMLRVCERDLKNLEAVLKTLTDTHTFQ